MLLRKRLKWVTAVVVLAVAAGAAAQPGGAKGSGASDAQVGFQRRAQLTPQQQIAESETSISRMEQSSAAVRKMLEQAREKRDVVKTLCLNDKLSQVDVAIRSARDRRA